MDSAAGPESTPAWEQRLLELTDFIQATGHTRVTPKNTRNMELRSWVVQQRLHARLGTIDLALRTSLDALGFDWGLPLTYGRAASADGPAPAEVEAQWNQRFDELLAFKAREGHFRVSIVKGNDRILGKWVSDQRASHRSRSLSDERFQRLNEVGFEWAPPRGIRPYPKPVPLAEASAGDGAES